ncbi:MAG: hypothetical protein HMLKMBBP_01070 [Planctomycetes bacterium]|nr:hypothetical protein [Planctomycetota bacterium]
MKHAKKQTKTAGKPSKGAPRKAPKLAVVKDAHAAPGAKSRDPRLPAAGTTLVRPYKGKDYRVTVLEAGFRYDGREFRSLSKLASEITGQASINGYLWMRLTGDAATAPRPKTARSKGKTPAPTETAPAPDPAPDAPSV